MTEIFKCESIEELKKIGKLKDVIIMLNGWSGNKLKLNFRSWKDLFEGIIFLRETLSLSNYKDDLYFKDETTKILFALCELEGEKRANLLGITREHYNKKKVAKDWQRKIVKMIHPDQCNHPKATEAIKKVNEIYESMVMYGE